MSEREESRMYVCEHSLTISSRICMKKMHRELCVHAVHLLDIAEV